MNQAATNLEDWNALAEGADPLNRDHHRPAVGAVPPAKVRYTHDAMIDAIVANPQISQTQLAAFFGYTPGWVSIIMSSDAFKARLAARREELVDPAIVISVEERFRALAERSLVVLQEKLAAPIASIPDNLALRAAELGAKALGIGGNAVPSPQPPSLDHLATLAGNLLALRGEVYNPQVSPIEGECHEVKQA